MEITDIQWNEKITSFVEKLGGVPIANKVGFYEIKGKEIDLTASGTEHWQIAKNILNQLDNIHTDILNNYIG